MSWLSEGGGAQTPPSFLFWDREGAVPQCAIAINATACEWQLTPQCVYFSYQQCHECMELFWAQALWWCDRNTAWHCGIVWLMNLICTCRADRLYTNTRYIQTHRIYFGKLIWTAGPRGGLSLGCLGIDAIAIAAQKFCFKTCVAMKFVDDDDDDDDDDC